MRLRAIALLAALLWGSSAQATTVTGTMKDVQGNLLSGTGDYATFQLMNFGSNVPRVTGTNIVVQTQPLRVTPAALQAGVTIQANDGITPATTFYRVTFYQGGKTFRSADHNITGGTYNLDSATPITTVPVVAPPTGDSTYLRLDAGNQNLVGPGWALPVKLVQTCPGADAGARIAACIALLPATGGTVDARGLEGPQIWSANPFTGIISIFFNSLKKVKVLLGATTITHSVMIDVPGDITLEGAGTTQTVFVYTGNTDAFRVNSVKYANLSGFQVDLGSAGANATGLHVVQQAGTFAPVASNSFSNIKIWNSSYVRAIGDPGPFVITPGQVGLKIDTPSAAPQEWATFNHFDNFFIQYLGQAILDVGINNEGNTFSNFTIDTCADAGYGVEVHGHRNSYNPFWIGFDVRYGAPTGGFLFSVATAGNVAVAMGDMGGGVLFNDLGTALGDYVGGSNLLLGRVIAPTGLGTTTGDYSFPLGRSRASGYDVSADSIIGADRQIFAAGVATFSNGFTVDYQNAAPKMVYSFLNGNVGIGTAAPTVGLLQLTQASGNNVDIALDQNGVGYWTFRNILTTGNLGILSGTTGTVVAEMGLAHPNTFNLKRIGASKGTALVAGDFTHIDANWGDTPAAHIGAVVGTDQAFTFEVHAGTANFGANPDVILTFKDLTWISNPICTASRGDATAPTTGFPTVTTNATSMTLTFQGLPAAGTYSFNVVCMGR